MVGDQPGAEHAEHAAAGEQGDDHADRRLGAPGRQMGADQDEGQRQHADHRALEDLADQQQRQSGGQSGQQSAGGDHGHQPEQDAFAAVAVAELPGDGG